MSEHSNSTEEEFKAKLLEMQAKFKVSLPGRLEEIDTVWERVLCDTDVTENLVLLHRLVHTLTGSAGTFFYNQLSKESRALEIVLKGLENEKISPTSEQVDQVSSLLKSLDAASQLNESEELLQSNLLVQPIAKEDLKVLVVDDDEDITTMLHSQLTHFGYQVRALTSISDSEQAIIEFKPDLIIADITFPEGNMAGIDELNRLDFVEMFGSIIPVIFISGRQDIDARLQAVRAGGASYLCKPINISILLEKVRELTCSDDEDNYQVMVVDDDSSLVDLITYVLEQVGMEVQGITDPKNALEAISRKKPDLILMDVHMPWCNGIELAQVIRQQPNLARIPIIFLSSETDEDLQFKAVLQGGDDFLSKPIDINRLAVFIKAKAQRARSLSALMIKDGLTGLYNHTYIKELVESEMSRVERNRSEFSVAMLDVDFFKKVNDTYGHIIGDQVLRSLSHFLAQRLRKADKIGRYGGEEFMVLLPDTKLEEAVQLFKEILADFSSIEHHDLGGKPFHVTFSCGMISNRCGPTTSALLEKVDQALYMAKHQGRNQVLATSGCDD